MIEPKRRPTPEEVHAYLDELRQEDWIDVVPYDEYEDDGAVTVIFFGRKKPDSND
jgi:hypothetical protein